ncbi:MAG: hypothetical protein JSS32_05890 [Verrucomicrobia bacterium]|nr:hypothetical protein [Verrucomicrobiota bacterium]
MRRISLCLLILFLPLSTYAQEMSSHNKRQAEIAGYATRDATVLSMMGWGLGLAVGIGALCALVQNETSSSSHSSSSTSH